VPGKVRLLGDAYVDSKEEKFESIYNAMDRPLPGSANFKSCLLILATEWNTMEEKWLEDAKSEVFARGDEVIFSDI